MTDEQKPKERAKSMNLVATTCSEAVHAVLADSSLTVFGADSGWTVQAEGGFNGIQLTLTVSDEELARAYVKLLTRLADAGALPVDTGPVWRLLKEAEQPRAGFRR